MPHTDYQTVLIRTKKRGPDPKRRKRSCDCVEKVGKLLAEQGTGLVLNMTLPDFFERPVVATRRNDDAPRGKAGKPKTVVAAFCPFCGFDYDLAANRAAKARR